jgi:hypothetical protein
MPPNKKPPSGGFLLGGISRRRISFQRCDVSSWHFSDIQRRPLFGTLEALSLR